MAESIVGFNPIFKEFNRTRCRYRLAKGSAGSGKSVDIAQDYILKLMDMQYKGANLLVVRKIDESNRDSTYAELKSAINRICGKMAPAIWTISKSPMEITCLKTGNKIIFRGMKDDSQREKVKSITFENGKLTWIWIEEATELDEDDIDILDDRLRGELPEGLYYQITFSFNPVSADHWIKGKYFDGEDPDIFTHHSTYLDNRFIDAAYHQRMERRRLRDPEGYRVYALGDWGLLGGRFFSMWNRNIHVCKPFAIPNGWLRFRSMDWGSYRPYSVGWYAVDFDGMIWKYRELYGYGGKANIGTEETSKQVAHKIVEFEKERMSYGVLDNACWNKQGTEGPTIAEEINKVLHEANKTMFTPSQKGREQGAEQLRLRLEGYVTSQDVQIPGICFFETCFHTIRTIPLLRRDKREPEKVDTTGEDHAFDECAYGLLSRPWTPKAPQEKKKQDRYRKRREPKTDWMAM